MRQCGLLGQSWGRSATSRSKTRMFGMSFASVPMRAYPCDEHAFYAAWCNHNHYHRAEAWPQVGRVRFRPPCNRILWLQMGPVGRQASWCFHGLLNDMHMNSIVPCLHYTTQHKRRWTSCACNLSCSGLQPHLQESHFMRLKVARKAHGVYSVAQRTFVHPQSTIARLHAMHMPHGGVVRYIHSTASTNSVA